MFHWLSSFSGSYSFLNLFRYITFRSIAALITSFFIMFLCCPVFIAWMKRLQKEGQPIRLDGPSTHFVKKGTPTLGGVLMLFSFFLSMLLWADLHNPYIWLMSAILLGYGILGGIDDYLKLTLKNSKGISACRKLLIQSIVALVCVMGLLYLHPPALSLHVFFPFFKGLDINIGYLYLFLGLLVIVGTSNAVNLTDGLDGLAIGPVMICCMVLGIFAYASGHHGFSDYLHLPFILGVGELAVLCSALVGTGLAFLWYNAPPALIFMGDVGSLSLGGFIGLLALALKQEFLLPIVGGLFLLEALSVMIQVAYFKKTGRRIFTMAPIHHHFEKRGWPESTVVFRFWIIAFLCGLIALSTLKVR